MRTWRQMLGRLPRIRRAQRRSVLKRGAALAALIARPALAAPARAAVAPLSEVPLSMPGPGNSVSLPLELAARIGLDRDHGIALRLRFVGGGGVAISELQSRNVDYAVLGLPAVMDADLRGGQLVALAAIHDVPAYTLMVRHELRGAVHRVADLRDRVVGIHSNTLRTRTTSQQVLELLLRIEHVPLDSVRMVAAGQSWETQAAALRSGAIDATVCDEPFGTRMMSEGLAFRLFSTGRPQDASRMPGSGFLRAVLVARNDAIELDPALAARMVATVRDTLHWIASHPANEIATALELAPGPERQSFLDAFRIYPHQYSHDGQFSQRQLQETETFFREAESDNAGARYQSLDSIVIDRWAGRKS